ncbi:alpha/beta hydrolase family protein [Sphaerothrix gracilis]|uniref:alpha/beta hydrolase family protein n=1 Tax=Sphaerothrix gracilis TaxID=3151835 RepID=UPI0031FDD56C
MSTLLGIALTLSSMTASAIAQTVWQDAPEPINTLLETTWIPATQISPDQQWLVKLARPPLPAIAELAQPRVQVAGLQLDPATHGPAQDYTFRGIEIQAIATGETRQVELPDGIQINNFRWSPQGQYLAFTELQPTGLALWVLNLATAEARQLTPPVLNGTYGNPCKWLSESEGLLCKTVPSQQPAPPAAPLIPAGPRVEENLGREAPNRTYTNLLRNAHDEALYEYYLTSVLEHISLTGDRQPLTPPLLIDSATPSPDSQWILLRVTQRPFSYQVPASLFPKRVVVLNRAGEAVFTVADLPLADDIPITFNSVRQGRRSIRWRPDRPATLYWVEALDGGDASKPVPWRDAVSQLDAPFTAEPQLVWQTELRYNRIVWGNEAIALGYEYWYDTRRLRTWQLNPANPDEARLLSDRDYQDRYSAPGQPVTAPGPYQRQVLLLTPDRESLYLSGRGASAAGVYPFLDRWHLPSGEKTRLWQAENPHYEQVVRLLDNQAEQIITRQQSPLQAPNYLLRNVVTDEVVSLTDFTDPMPWFAGITREVVRYQRADGVTLSATLYLPPGYDPNQDGPLPTLLWVYPQEYKSREAAAQVTTAENAFSRPWGHSPLFLLTQGYAILMGPTLPIIGEGEAEPNDTYLEQLKLGAQAAVDYLVERGVSRANQVAIGGHSYGAFTAANLLAHTDLFQAGIANSGAYNRSLTPFGFQGEQRNFWQAPEIYSQLSPFTYAHQINEPLLLIHGAEDPNVGTYPLQSERLYEALQGLGGTVRWVELPFEGHGYESREAVSHVLWEMTQWLDRYVKGNNSPPVSAPPARESRAASHPGGDR